MTAEPHVSPGPSDLPEMDDIFEDALSLEDQYYQEGYQLGVTDGSRAGRIEGRVFGLEKGFEKFVNAGKMHGKAAVWSARLPQQRASAPSLSHLEGDKTEQTDEPSSEIGKLDEGMSRVALHPAESEAGLPQLSSNPRLEKHIQTVFALVEPGTIPTQNAEDAVSEIDDRIKRAEAKAKVIEKIIGESQERADALPQNSNANSQRRARISNNARLERNMEDFQG